jgi:uncharacterized protein YhbP (UPF0306 family)
MAEDTRERALRYLESHHVMTLATYGESGVWAAAVFYAHEDFDLYFLSAATTRHARDFLARPQVAAAIHEDYQDWRAIRGIQLEGNVAALEGEHRERAIALYRRRFPFIATAGELAAALSRISWFRLRPDRLYFVDNSRGFGQRDEVMLR